jgi:hypothetical protein
MAGVASDDRQIQLQQPNPTPDQSLALHPPALMHRSGYMDRYGYDVLPLALRLLAGETLPPRTVTQHTLVTAANVFRQYPPFDMN